MRFLNFDFIMLGIGDIMAPAIQSPVCSLDEFGNAELVGKLKLFNDTQIPNEK